MLEHVHNPGAIVFELFRTLRTGGTALITVPFLFPIHGGVDGEGDSYRFSKAELTYILSGAGFSEIEVTDRGGVGTSVATLFNAAAIRVHYRLSARTRAAIALLPAMAGLFVLSQLAGVVLDWFDRSGEFPTWYEVTARKAAR